jgi:hypothetical protein
VSDAFALNDRAEIEADLEQQGWADEVSYDDVAATFGLYRSMSPLSEYGPPPKPAMGEDFRYTPEPGEEDIFADPSDMWFPPES